MRTGLAASVPSALLRAQGLPGFAGVAGVLLKDRAHAADTVVIMVAGRASSAPAR